MAEEKKPEPVDERKVKARVVVEFVRKSSPYNRGELAGFVPEVAQRYIEKGIAVEVESEAKAPLRKVGEKGELIADPLEELAIQKGNDKVKATRKDRDAVKPKAEAEKPKRKR